MFSFVLSVLMMNWVGSVVWRPGVTSGGEVGVLTVDPQGRLRAPTCSRGYYPSHWDLGPVLPDLVFLRPTRPPGKSAAESEGDPGGPPWLGVRREGGLGTRPAGSRPPGNPLPGPATPPVRLPMVHNGPFGARRGRRPRGT